jgi:hypothetical protein
MTREHLIAPLAVRELAAAGALREAVAIADPAHAAGWLMRVRTGTLERSLRMRDAARPRRFQSVDAVVAMARKFGLRTLVVDLGSAHTLAPQRSRAR